MKHRKDLYRRLRRMKTKGYCMKCKLHYASFMCRKCNDLVCGCQFGCCKA